MSTQSNIEHKLATLQPQHLRVENESHQHNVPAGSESHFKVTMVAAQFGGKNLLARHRLVNEVLAQELANGVHALALHLFTPDEWVGQPQVADSPLCMGGSARRRSQ